MNEFYNDIRELQNKASEMTFDEFWGWVRKECSKVVMYGDLAEFRYRSVNGIIDAKNDRLCGGFGCFNNNTRFTTIHSHSVYFKK